MLAVEGLTVRYRGTVAVDDVDLEVRDGELVCVLGPSGSGKSTLLRAVAGLERPSAGRVLLAGEDVTARRPDERRVGLMFQDGALFPHRDVATNVGFGLRMQGRSRTEVRRRTDEVLELVGLAGFGRRGVDDLSGGERQRVALARTLAPEPRVVMLDEPLGSLDRALRDVLVGELRELFGRLGSTVLYVTHDQDEALALADRLVVMRAGEIVQSAAPDELWRRPATGWVARFLGQHNLVSADVDAGEAATVIGAFPAPGVAGGPAEVLLLPEALRLASSGLPGVVVGRRFAGDHVVVDVRLDAGPVLAIACWGGGAPRVGDAVTVEVSADATRVVPPG